MPGIFTASRAACARSAMRFTCTITRPPQRFAACAIDIISPKIGLLLHGDVAVFVGRRAAQEADVDRNGL